MRREVSSLREDWITLHEWLWVSASMRKERDRGRQKRGKKEMKKNIPNICMFQGSYWKYLLTLKSSCICCIWCVFLYRHLLLPGDDFVIMMMFMIMIFGDLPYIHDPDRVNLPNIVFPKIASKLMAFSSTDIPSLTEVLGVSLIDSSPLMPTNCIQYPRIQFFLRISKWKEKREPMRASDLC